jgi:N utilization substance protein A
MKNDFAIAVNQVCSERSLSREVVVEAIEAALISAYKRNFGTSQNITAKIEPESGQVHVYAEKEVVEEVTDQRLEISLAEAGEIDDNAVIGSTVLIETTPRNFGRIAAQTAKQVILQRIREAEREALYSSYVDREGEIITGTVQSVDSQAITLNLGKTEAVLPRGEQIPGERYRINQRIKAYVLEVQKTSRGPQIIVSRTHRNMLRRLLELEVPEIFNGTVEIKNIAREAGSRSKVAVVALQEGVDPVGSCVGMRGVRIQSIVNELNGEKIDIVEWNLDTGTSIANALSPAKVLNVELEDGEEGGKTATVIVPDHQLSLAIGKEGQNARLAAKLAGWRIDIKSASEAAEEALRKEEEAKKAPAPTPAEDILAVAEAILMKKESEKEAEVSTPVEVVDTEAAAVEPEVPPVAEEEIRVEEMISEATAPAIEPVSEEVGEEVEPLAEGTEIAAFEEEEEPGEFEATEEEEVEPLAEEEEELEEIEEIEEIEHDLEWREGEEESETRSKREKRQRKRTLVFDEDLGQVVSKRRRKPSRRQQDWDVEDY